MALNFPDSPIVGDIYTDNTSGFSYEWDGVVWKSYTPSASKNITVLDDISGSFDGIQTIFPITVSAVSFTPANAQQLRIVLGGVVQEPGSDYTVSGTSLVFTTPPTGGLSFSGVSLGPAVPVGVPGDGTVTPVKLSTGGPTWNSSGDLNVTGITTLNNKVKVGVGTTALIVEGDARITGILTIGTSSITFDGTNNSINVGTGVTISSSGINVGVITATSFFGDGSGLTGVGIGTDGSINTSGIITASTITANKFEGSGDDLIFSPTVTSFSPIDGDTGVLVNTNIVLTFNQPIYAGVGSIFLRNSSGIGTEIEAIGIGSTTQISINNQTLVINPSANLPIATDVYVVLPQGVVKNAVGGNNVLLDTYNFTTIDFAFSSINPTNGATNVGIDTSITLTFTNTPTRGTGTVQIKEGNSTTGTVVESFDAASSGQINIVGNNWILTPSSNLGYTTSIHTIIPSTAIIGYVGLNTTGADSHSFTTEGLPALGSSFEGGYLICTSGGTAWIVAPSSSEVSRDWYTRNDANTRAQQVSGCSGWFVPDINTLVNPGYTCRVYWDSFASGQYTWSSTERSASHAWYLRNATGVCCCGGHGRKTFAQTVRAFRCINY